MVWSRDIGRLLCAAFAAKTLLASQVSFGHGDPLLPVLATSKYPRFNLAHVFLLSQRLCNLTTSLVRRHDSTKAEANVEHKPPSATSSHAVPHAEGAQRSDKVERSGDGGSGIFPDFENNMTSTRQEEPSAATRPSAAETGVRGFPPTSKTT